MQIEISNQKDSSEAKPGDILEYISYNSEPYYYIVLKENKLLGLTGNDRLKVFNDIDFKYIKLPPGSKVVLTVE